MPKSTTLEETKAPLRGKAKFMAVVDPSTGRQLSTLVCKGLSATPVGFSDHVRLFGERWNIVYCRGLYETEGRKRKKLYGMCLGNHRMIVIETDCPRHEMIDTLYHEMGHVYVRVLVPPDAKFFKYEETIVEVFAKGLSDAAANNRLPTEVPAP